MSYGTVCQRGESLCQRGGRLGRAEVSKPRGSTCVPSPRDVGPVGPSDMGRRPSDMGRRPSGLC